MYNVSDELNEIVIETKDQIAKLKSIQAAIEGSTIAITSDEMYEALKNKAKEYLAEDNKTFKNHFISKEERIKFAEACNTLADLLKVRDTFEFSLERLIPVDWSKP